jgi:hypothetical protein
MAESREKQWCVAASFRVQFYNITNAPHFGQPNVNLGNVNGVGAFEPTRSSDKLHPYCPAATANGSWVCALLSNNGGRERSLATSRPVLHLTEIT